MKLRDNNSEEKLRGAYYTPFDLASQMVEKFIELKEKIKILEPSCGDGVFVDVLNKKVSSLEKFKIESVDINGNEIKKLSKKYSFDKRFKFVKKDFFNYYNINKNKKFDVIIGNPPYIRYQYLDEDVRYEMSKILKENDMKPNKLINSWVGFTVASTRMLNDNGTLAFVVPAELLQVVYAKELRLFLSKNFNQIDIVTFEKLVFDEIEQEIVLLVCKKTTCYKGIRIIQTYDVKSFSQINLSDYLYQTIDNVEDKWTKYFTNNDELKLITKIKNDNRFHKLSDTAIINVGITTGNNEFFSIDKETNEKYKLNEYCVPLVGKSCQVQGTFFTKKDLEYNYNKGRKSFLLYIKDNEKNKLSDSLTEYIFLGECNNINTGYKCKIRNKWYCIPSVWVPDAFFTRRNGLYPKFVLNKCGAVSTDTMHRIKFKDGIDHCEIVLSYYNSVSFAFTEICGRSYGGGVLEILPSEMGNIRVPKLTMIDFETKKKLLSKVVV